MTGDLAVMDATCARALTDRIKVGVEAIWELITQAYTERAWDALGYSSWDDYCTREFGTSRLRLPREERAEVVASLRESGLSIRAIASATGHSKDTIRKDLYQIGTPATPEPVTAELADDEAACIHCGEVLPLTQLYEGGQGYECDPCVSPDPADELVTESESINLYRDQELPPLPENYMQTPPVAPEPAPVPKPITGRDGKTYNPKPAVPQTPKRKPLPETFDRAKQELRSAVARVTNLMADDRLEKNKDQISGANLSDLIRVRDALSCVIQQLEG